MGITVRAHDAPVSERVDYWEHAIAEALLPMRGRHRGAGDFQAEMVAGTVGAIRVAQSSTPQGECFRTPKLIRQIDPDVYQIDVMCSGEVVAEQNGRQVRLGATDIALIDPARPVRYHSTPSTHVSVLFPRLMLALPADTVTRLAPIHIPGDRGTGALVSTLTRALPRHLDECRTGEAVRLGSAVVDLVGTAVAAQLDRDLDVDDQPRAMLSRIYAYIDAHLGDRDLSPASIAAAHHISRRYLHKLFEPEPATIAEWIRQRRLDRCRRDLVDPSLRERSVAAIASRWGLPDAAHFSRIFKNAYGCPPAEYRLALATSPLLPGDSGLGAGRYRA
jgi:AraC-like DNA-binding protein